MTDTDAELTFGALDWLADPYYALASGRSHGAPEPLVTALPRLLMDGEIITHERDSNRDLSFRLEIVGDDVLALNEAEAALVVEVNKPRNTLRWKPPGMNTPVTVFDTFAGFVVQVFDEDDDLEEIRGKRVYQVTLPALPHARSETLRTSSLAGRTTPTLLDACDSLTNWSGVTGGPTPTVDSGALKVSDTVVIGVDGTGSSQNPGWRRTASFAAASGTYVSAELRSNYPPGGMQLTAMTATGGYTGTLVSAVALAGGVIEYTWALQNEDAVTVTWLEFRPTIGPGTTVAGTYTVDAWLNTVKTFSEAVPSDLAGLRLLDTGGSVRTPGTLRLGNDTTPLGDVLVATWEDKGDGFRPDVARWYATGGTQTTDPASVSGSTYSGGAAFDVPNRSLAPGPYAVFVKPTSGAVPDGVVVDAQTWIGGAFVGPEASVRGSVASAAITPLGIIHLPAATTPRLSSGVTRLTVNMIGVSGEIDELWLFRIDGQLTWLEDIGRRVWLESPSPDLPYGGVWVGDAADESDAYHPGAKLRMLGRHVFEAPAAAVYVAATGAAPSLDLLHYRRWHSNAAD